MSEESEVQQQHTPEPWRWLRNLHAVGPLKGAYIDDVAGTARVADVLSHGGVGQEGCEVNARRIVACVNACKGIPTGNLERSATWLRRKAGLEEARRQSRPDDAT